MHFNIWQIGLEIQHLVLRAVAVQRQRQGWQLRHWWEIPLPDNTLREGVLQSPENLMQALADWRRELPLRHQLRVAFPTQRTLQRPVPAPDNRLEESARERYLATATAHQLQMQPTQLSWDYTVASFDPTQVLVTAARYSEAEALLTCLSKQRLFPATLTPGASVLPVLSSVCNPDKTRFLVHREQDHWLWATTQSEPTWGWIAFHQVATFSALCQQLEAKPEEIALSSSTPESLPDGAMLLDAWRALSRLQPPLPQHGGSFTVAIGLAIGRMNR